MPRDPHKLEVFRLVHQLAIEVYRVTEGLPVAERFGLQAQLRRAAVSIPANLVEGCPLSIPGNDLGNCWWLCRRTQAYSCEC